MANFMSALSGAMQKAQEEARKEAQRRSGIIRSRQKYVDEDAAPVTVSRRGEGLGTGPVGKTSYSQPNANNAIKTINSNRAEQSPAATGGGIDMSTIQTGIYGAPIGAYDDQQRIYGDAVASQLERSRQLRDSALAARLGIGNMMIQAGQAARNAGGNALVEGAKKYLGTPYKWGGNSPEEGGMDCSGYMKKVYKEVTGIDIPRTTYEQVNQGTVVPKEDLRPGDLVFFANKTSGVHHVGMYIGNDQFIHEPQTGDVAKISKLSDRKDFYGARRYTK